MSFSKISILVMTSLELFSGRKMSTCHPSESIVNLSSATVDNVSSGWQSSMWPRKECDIYILSRITLCLRWEMNLQWSIGKKYHILYYCFTLQCMIWLFIYLIWSPRVRLTCININIYISFTFRCLQSDPL